MNFQPSSAACSRSCRNHLPLLHRRKILWFLSRISNYLEKDCTPSEAIDFAIDDCIMEGIFYSLFIHRRTEVKELLLQQFPPSFTYCLWCTSSDEIRLYSAMDER